MYSVIVNTPALVEPLTLAEAKEQLRIDLSFTLDDDYIGRLISVSRDRVEKYCNRFFTEQVVTIVYDQPFPMSEIVLPFPDLQSVDELAYYQNSTITTISPSNYYVDLVRQRIINTGTWSDADNYRVTVTTGAPQELGGVKQAMLLMITDMYELRTETVIGQSLAENPAVKAALYPYRESLGI